MYLLKNILSYIFSFALGSVIGSYYLINIYFILIIFTVSIVCVIRSILLKFKLISVVCLCLMFLSLGIFRGNIFSSSYVLDENTNANIGKYLNIEGVIVNNPEVKNGKQYFVIKTNDVLIETTLKSIPLFSYGMKVNVYGKLVKPENFYISNNKEVRYESLMRARGIVLKLDGKRASVISAENGNYVYEKLYKFKRYIATVINRISSPESGLLFSMVFGGKSNLDNTLIENFRIAGLLHIIVLSGQNLTIIAYLAVLIFSYTCGFKVGHFLALLAVITYAIIGGLEPATLRAVFMSSILIILLMYGRVGSAGRVLFFSALCMIIINPYILFDDPSFQLSVLAFLGIIYVAPPIKIWLIERDFGQKMSDYISAIFGAQLSVMPFIIYSSQVITPYSLLSNFFVLFMVGIITIYGMVSTIIGTMSVALFDLITLPLTFALKYILLVSKYISELPYSSISFNFGIYLMAIIYIYMIIFLYKRWKKIDMQPLSIFIQENEKQQLKKGIIPYVEEIEYIKEDGEYKKDIIWN